LLTQPGLSVAELIALLPDSEKEQALAELATTDTEQTALAYDWAFWARPKQLPPSGDWRVWLIRSGRGFGKTRTGAEWVRYRAEHGPYYPIALVGQTKADVRDTMVELGESSILKVSPPWFRPHFEASKRRLTWPNGMTATIFSGDEPDQLRGPQHGSAWVDEFAKFRYPKDTWDNLMLGLRLGADPRALVTSTPRPIPIIKQLIADPYTVDVTGSTYDNAANLSPVFLDEVRRQYEGTRLGKQELYGEILEDNPGALWQRATLEACRVKVAPELTRIVVAIDPAATSGKDSDETGIVVCGKGSDGHGYVLDDLSLRATPDGWARAAIKAYHAFKADRIVVETNQGGEMVSHTLRTIEPTLPITQIHASRGKQVRAEPVAALFEQGKCHMVGNLPDLEEQLCSWTIGDASPDRLDSMVYCLTDLLVTNTSWLMG